MSASYSEGGFVEDSWTDGGVITYSWLFSAVAGFLKELWSVTISYSWFSAVVISEEEPCGECNKFSSLAICVEDSWTDGVVITSYSWLFSAVAGFWSVTISYSWFSAVVISEEEPCGNGGGWDFESCFRMCVTYARFSVISICDASMKSPCGEGW